MSIVRVGLAETKKFSDGYDAIFRKRKSGSDTAQSSSAAAKSQAGKKKKAKKAKKK